MASSSAIVLGDHPNHATGMDTGVDGFLYAVPISILLCPARRSRDDMMFDLQVKNILCCLENFNNGVPEDDNDGAAHRLRRRK